MSLICSPSQCLGKLTLDPHARLALFPDRLMSTEAMLIKNVWYYDQGWIKAGTCPRSPAPKAPGSFCVIKCVADMFHY